MVACANYRLVLAILGHLLSTSTRIDSSVAAASDLQHPLKEIKVERNEALCAGGGNGYWQDRSSDS